MTDETTPPIDEKLRAHELLKGARELKEKYSLLSEEMFRARSKMTAEIQIEQGREGEIDPRYGYPIGSRRLKIEKLHHKLREKYHALRDEVSKKFKESLRKIIEESEKFPSLERVDWLIEHGYLELLGSSYMEKENLQKSPLGMIVNQETLEIFDVSDHENMLNASGSVFRNDSDPVLSTILSDGVYKLNVPGNTRRERKKSRHRADIYGRRLQKHVYEKYLSQAVGKPITIEEYEREFGFLSGKGEVTK